MLTHRRFFSTALLGAVLLMAACGERVEVPPAHVGKIMTDKGYQEGLRPSSKFRLAPCWAYCDKLVLLDISDKTSVEKLSVFMPEDKLNVGISIQTTLALNPKKIDELFVSLKPTSTEGGQSLIEWKTIYDTYSAQIIQTEVREYLSKYSISEVASSMEKVNSDLRVALTKIIAERTPFNVRYIGITNVAYPKIITDAQENAAERRERIQQEEAQLQISKVTLERELQETRLTRQIELEKAQIEATSQRIQREVVDEKVLELRRIENESARIAKWNGQLPTTVYGNGNSADLMFLMGGAK